MRSAILVAVTTLGLAAAGLAAGLSSPILPAAAQPVPGAPPPPMGADGAHGPGPWGMEWRHPAPGPRGMEERRAMMHQQTFALMFHPADRALSGADVQKIAEAFLLWNGNHTWKITAVTEQDESTVGFSVATPSGDVIARFTMNRHTGQVARVS